MSPTLLGFVRWAVARTFERPALGIAGLVGILVQVGCSIVTPLALEYLIDTAIPTQDRVALGWAVAAVAAATLLYFLGGLAVDYTSARLGAETIAKIRMTMFQRIQEAPPAFFRQQSDGDVMTRFSADCAVIEGAVVRALPVLVRRVLKILFAGVVLFTIDARLAMLVVIALPISVLASRPIAKRGSAADVDRKQHEGAVAKLVQESVVSRTVVRVFELEAYLQQRLAHTLEVIREASVRTNVLYALTGSLSSLGIAIVELAVLGIGAIVVVGGGMTVGLLVAFLGLLRNVSASARGLTDIAPPLMGGATSLARVWDLLGLESSRTVADGSVALSRLNDRIVFEDVTFAYEGQAATILEKLSLEIRAGQRVAFVGRSGSGKSTTLSLIMRLLEPRDGRIVFDGIDIRDATETSLRSQTAVVFQDTALFDASIRENIRCGRLGADDAAIEDAARRARIHDLIAKLPQSYDSSVGPGGTRISGGQRQRVAIARALIRDPSLLLLDEATSALDPAAEADINDTLREVSRGHTVVAVTHRLNSVVDYDSIMVFDAGRIVERGTHEVLLAQCGLYAELWAKQSGFEVAANGTAARVAPARLRQIPFLADAPDAALATLSRTLSTVRFGRGEVVFERGAPGDRFYLIARGELEAYVTDDDGEIRILRIMDDGDFFGEIALVEEIARTASVRAITDSVCLTLERAEFERFIEAFPAVSKTVIAAANQRLAHG